MIILLFLTLETANPLAESLGGYENISIVHELEPPSIEFLRIVKDEITAGEIEFVIYICCYFCCLILERPICLGYFIIPVVIDALSIFRFLALNFMLNSYGLKVGHSYLAFEIHHYWVAILLH